MSCSRHGVGGGWQISDPCEECVAIALGNAYKLSYNKVAHASSASSSSEPIPMTGIINKDLAVGGASSPEALVAVLPSVSPPLPPPATCFRHRGGGEGVDPCEECLAIAMSSDLN